MNTTTEETINSLSLFPSTNFSTTKTFFNENLITTTLNNFLETTTTNNIKLNKRDVSFQFSLIFGSLIGGVTIVGSAANILVVIAILSDKKMRKSPMNLLLLNLVSKGIVEGKYFGFGVCNDF